MYTLYIKIKSQNGLTNATSTVIFKNMFLSYFPIIDVT